MTSEYHLSPKTCKEYVTVHVKERGTRSGQYTMCTWNAYIHPPLPWQGRYHWLGCIHDSMLFGTGNCMRVDLEEL